LLYGIPVKARIPQFHVDAILGFFCKNPYSTDRLLQLISFYKLSEAKDPHTYGIQGSDIFLI
jgi:hypothetical protein